MSPEDEHFNIISGAEASTDSHYIYNRSRMKNNTLFKDNLMSLLQSNINSQLYCATCHMALAEEGRAVRRNLFLFEPRWFQTLGRLFNPNRGFTQAMGLRNSL